MPDESQITISIIAAIAQDGTIGDNGTMPWHLPADLKWFVQKTKNRPLVMGRRTFDAIGKPLKNRPNIVLCRSKTFSSPGITVVHSVREAITIGTKLGSEIMVIGGAETYRQFIPLCNRLYLTFIHHSFSGDTKFPMAELANFSGWRSIFCETYPTDDRNQYPLTFYILERSIKA